MTKPNERHVPVLLKEAIDFLRVRAGGTYVDCTLGMAGHSAGIARLLGPKGHLIGFDRDPEALELARTQAGRRSAEELGSEAPQSDAGGRGLQFHRRACEAGFGGWHSGRLWRQQPATRRSAQGIQFSGGRPLDMRMDTRSGPTAAQVVNEANERELANLIYEYGEERRSRRIARAIVRGRPVTTTGQLARIVAQPPRQ